MARTGTSPAGSRAAGFTLLELLVVLAILGLVAAIGLPAFMPRGSAVEVRRAALELAAELRRTRAHAIGAGTEAVLTLDVEAGAYAMPGRGSRLPPGTAAELTSAATERVGPSAGGIRFFPDGSSTGGIIRLEGGGQRLEVAVDWLTGRVLVRDAAP